MSNNIGKTLVNSVISAFFGNWFATIKTEVEIAKIEMKYKAKQLGAGIGMLVAAAVLSFFVLLVLLTAAIAGLSEAFPVWLSALIIGGAMLLIVLVLALIGASKVKKNKDITPDRAINNIKNSMPF